MQDSDIPSKFPIPWANGASSSYTRVIPEASQPEGAASLTDGFPPATFTPLASGGSPPDGRDMNGILNIVTRWLRWSQAGGPIAYDSTYQSAIGGYPKGAIVASATTFGILWISTVNANTTNPDSSGAGWTRWDVVGSGSSGALTIAASGVTSGTYNYPKTFVVGSDGRITSISGDASAVGGVLTGNLPNPGLSATGVAAGTYAKAIWTVTTAGRMSAVVANDNGSTQWSSAGTYTFTVPAGATVLRYRIIGGGGGGGATSNSNSAASGGGGGGFGSGLIGVSPGTVITITVGAGGARATSLATGGSGGDTSIAWGGTYIAAFGGQGGQSADGDYQSTLAQGGGYSGPSYGRQGYAANGAFGVANSFTVGSTGGGVPNAAGASAPSSGGYNVAEDGQSGLGPGGGGGGGINGGNGGSGAAGEVYLEWF